MKQRKLNYRFHDPNPAAATAGHILKIFIEANAGKVEAAVREASGKRPPDEDGQSACREGHSA